MKDIKVETGEIKTNVPSYQKSEPVVEEKRRFKPSRKCDWSITRLSDNSIFAKNSVTQEVFEGEMLEFNKILRG